MSQHDFEITTTDANSGPSMRTQMDDALQALASNSSGTSGPSTPYAYMWWADTTTGTMKQRNAANTAWLERGALGADWVTAGLGEMPSGVEFTGDIVGGSFAMNSSDATNDTDFGSIVCMDSTNTSLISSTGTITKRLDAAWAVGTGNGGLANGSKTVSTLYHLYAILKTSDDTVDFMYLEDGDAIATYIPSGYAKFKWIGFVRTNAAGAICRYAFNNGKVSFGIGSENVLSAAVGTSYAAVDHTTMLPTTRISYLLYGVRHASLSSSLYYTIDSTNTEGRVGTAQPGATDTSDTAWGSALDGQDVPYAYGRSFKASQTSTSLLCHSVELIR